MACSSLQSLSSATEPDSESADSVTTDTSSTQSAAISLLDKLRPQKTSELSQKRKVQENPESTITFLEDCNQTHPKLVTPSQRVREFLTKQLTVSASKMFCTACREELAYLAKTADVSPDFDCLKWWEKNCGDLSNWSSATLKVLLVQPSSAAAERVLSFVGLF